MLFLLFLLLFVIFILAGNFEALVFELVMFDEFICATVICISLVKDVLTDFIKILLDIQIELEKFLHYLSVNLRIFCIHLLFGDEV